MSDGELLLLRHGEIASHRGDVPLTASGVLGARQVGEAIGRRYGVPVRVLTSRTLRARQTGTALTEGIRASGGAATGPADDDALRNPDMYVGGQRVDMVSSGQALAEQVSGLSPLACAALPFWRDFMPHPDRIQYWLDHPNPPGDDSRSVARRILAGFAATLFDSKDNAGRLVIGVTHSPILRACARGALGDSGEPPVLTGLRITPRAGGLMVTFADLLAEQARSEGSWM